MKKLKHLKEFLNEARTETRFDQQDNNKYLKVGTRFSFDKTGMGAKNVLMDFVIDKNWDNVSNHTFGGDERSAKIALEFKKELAKLAKDFEKEVDKLKGKYS